MHTKEQLDIMNLSVEQENFRMSCLILGRTYFTIIKLPSEKDLIIHIFAIVVSGILIIPTVLLNAVAVITISKSSQLKSKPCYFIILVQSMIDLAVGVLGIPLFIFFLANGTGGVSNCFAAMMALKSTLIPVVLSVVTLSAMTLERYIAILHPYAYSTQVTKKRLLISVGSGAMLVISWIFLSFFIHGTIRTGAAVITTFIFFFNAFAYTRIYLVVKKLARSQNQLHDAFAEENLTRMKLFLREMKQAKSCFIVVICFFFLVFLPTAISPAVSANFNKFDKLEYTNWTVTFSLSNASVNSVIFFWTKTMLRKEAFKILKNISLC